MSQSEQPTAKVLFRVSYEDGTEDVETLWAFDLGGNRYRLANSPSYAYSVSWEDIVYAPFSQADMRPTFERVVEKSGHRTVRLMLDVPIEDGNASSELLRQLVALGCSYEGADRKLISVDIPPGVDLSEIRSFLIEQQATWEYADPTYEELFPHAA